MGETLLRVLIDIRQSLTAVTSRCYVHDLALAVSEAGTIDKGTMSSEHLIGPWSAE
jgi:hypothetical protein